MPAIITNKFRINNAEQFSESFSEATPEVYYLGIGRPQAFATQTRGDLRTENQGTDVAAVTPADSIIEEFNTFDDLLAVKKVQPSDVSFVIPRRNWTNGTIYDYYRHDYGNRITNTTTIQTSNSGATTLFDSTFYVLNSQRNVYKCLDNNNGAASTFEPTGTSTAIIITSDNYKWKYMYSLSAAQQSNFLSTDFMAVTTNSTVSTSAIDGAINVVKIKSAGSGGTNGTFTNIPIRGDGTGGLVTIGVGGGVVSSLVVTVPGTGYTIASIRNADIVAAGATGLSGAEIDCIIEPKGGHGFNAVTELGGFFVMINVSLEGTEITNSGDFTAENDFRRIVLLRNPFSAGFAASAATLRATKAVRFASSPTPGTFTVDEEINQTTTGAVGKVVEYDSTNRILHYIQTRFNDEGVDVNGNRTAFTGVNQITGQTSGATGTPSAVASETADQITFTNGYNDTELDRHKGDVLYIENRAPIQRSADQTENIKLVIEF
jgi:hypothetical protein